MHITIEETDEGFVLCLHLLPSEISNELRDFASLRRGPNPLPQRLNSTVQRTALSSAAPGRPPSSALDVGVVRERTSPAREDIISILDQAVRAKKEPLGGAVGALSRGLGNLMFGTGIDPRAGVSISQQLAELTNSSIAEVHLSIAGPFLAETTSGGALGRAVVNDLRTLARDGDVPALKRIFDRLEATEARLVGVIGSQTSSGSVFGDSPAASASAGRGLLVLRSGKALKNVRELKRQAELMGRLAEKVQGEP